MRSSPCGGVVGTTSGSGISGKVLASQRQACSFGTYTWVQIQQPGRTVWVADMGQIRSCGGSSGGSTGGNGCRIGRNFPLYKQCGQSWSNDRLGSSSTICAVGCLMTSVSSGMAGFGKSISGQTPNPRNLNSFLRSNGGYSGNLFVWGAVSRFGLSYEGQTSDHNAIKRAICANKIVVLNVNGGGHWVLATGYDGSTYFVNDSGYSRSSYTQGQVVRAGIYRV